MTIRRTVCTVCKQPFIREDKKVFCEKCEKTWAEYYAKWNPKKETE